jgi:acyl-CoA reductase-like NAD-dependent aldehyde dehydrogenase
MSPTAAPAATLSSRSPLTGQAIAEYTVDDLPAVRAAVARARQGRGQ